MATFHFELVSPERLLFAGEVESVVVPGTDGQITVLKNHAPFMTTLRPGVVEIAGGKEGAKRLYVRGGFADIAPTGLTVLAESAAPVDELDASILGLEIKVLEGLSISAETDEDRMKAGERLSQLRELKQELGL